MGEIIFITADHAELTARSRAVLDVLGRLKQTLKPHPAASEAIGPEAREIGKAHLMRAVNRLHDAGRLSFKESTDAALEIIYIASREARDQVFSVASSAAWTEKILKRHRNAYRTSAGTLFRFPFEDREGYLQAFITDWSPFPAAAALAVHKDHPSMRRVTKRQGSYFTGQFVRNPLTGDLMPVWITTWVKPEFGTGVVAVNPAHDKVDLGFAREVGLPIRFGLVRGPVESDPSTWPQPPVIKEGITIKTGGWDGISHQEALDKYFEVLSAHGYAERHLDRSVRGCPVASFHASTDGHDLMCVQCSSLRESEGEFSVSCHVCGGAYMRGTFAGGNILRAVLEMGERSAHELLCPAVEIETALLCARLLFVDLFARSLEPQKIHLVQEAEKTSVEVPDDLVGPASLMAAPLDQIAVLKQPVLDQTKLFRKRHEELLSGFQQGETTAAATQETPLKKALVRAQDSLVRWNLAEAFSTLYKAQKELSGKPLEEVSDLLPGYFILTFILTGYDYPPSLRVAELWNEMQNTKD